MLYQGTSSAAFAFPFSPRSWRLPGQRHTSGHPAKRGRGLPEHWAPKLAAADLMLETRISGVKVGPYVTFVMNTAKSHLIIAKPNITILRERKKFKLLVKP